MSVKITREVLEGYLRRALFEDTYNTYTDFDNARAGTQFIDDEILDIPDAPIAAGEQMAVQLSNVRPPVEDETYIPSNPIELGLASDVIGRMIPNDQVEYFYQRLKALWDVAQEKGANPEVMMDEEEAEIGELSKNENLSIRKLRHGLRQLIEQPGFDEEEYGEFRQGYSTIEPEEEEEEAITLAATEQVEGMGLEDLAAEFGYSAASGVRQSMERILGRLNFTMENVDDSELDAIKQSATTEFIELLVGEDYIDPSDAEELLANPSEVEALDSFRFFLVGGFLLPAYQGILRNTRKRVEAEVDKLGLPKRSRQTLMHQIFGDTPRNPEKLKKKIFRDAADEGMDSNKATKVAQQAEVAFSKLSNLAKVEGNLVAMALDAWNKSGATKKKNVLRQALESTAGHQEQFEQ